MRRILLVLLLLLLPVALAQPNVEITAPETAVPGETLTVRMQASIDNITIIGAPVSLTVSWPDGEQTSPQLVPDGSGMIDTQLYVPLEGTYSLEATLRIGSQEHAFAKKIQVGKPALNAEVSVNETHVRVSSDKRLSYTVRVIQAQAGPLAQAPIQNTCTLTCTDCEQACEIGSSLAYITVTDGYEYGLLRTAQQLPDRLIASKRPVSTPQTFLYINAALRALASQTSFSDDAQTIVQTPDGYAAQTVRVLDQNATKVSAQPAYDTTSGQWYAYVNASSGPVIVDAANASLVRAVDFANGQELSSQGDLVIAQGPFEALLSTARTSPQLPEITANPFATRIDPSSQTPLRVRTDATAAVRISDAYALPVSQAAYIDAPAILLNATRRTLLADSTSAGYEPVRAGENRTLLTAGSTRMRILSTELDTVYEQPIASTQNTTWTPRLPPGRYVVLLEGQQPAVQPIQILSQDQEFITDPAQTYETRVNEQLEMQRTITNARPGPQVIDVRTDSPYVLLLSSSGERLIDTNLNGIPDTGMLGPEQSVRITASALVPPNAVTSNVTWILSGASFSEQIIDTVQVLGRDPRQSYDVAITDLSQRSITTYSSYPQEQNVTLLLEHVANNQTEQQSLVLRVPTGEHGHSIDVPADVRVLSARIAVEDAYPANNVRERIIGVQSQQTLSLSEPYARNHSSYYVKAELPPGEYTFTYPDRDGTFSEAGYVVLSQDQESQQVLIRLPLAANTQLDVSVQSGGSPDDFDASVLLDNRDAQTRGQWVSSTQTQGYYAADYLTDFDTQKGSKSVTYSIDDHGYYEVFSRRPADPIFASNTRIQLGDEHIVIDQRKAAQFSFLGRYELSQELPIIITNAASDGFVVADAFRLVPVDQYAQLRTLGKQAEEPRGPVQQQAVVGEPVRWVKRVPVNASLERIPIHGSASNIEVREVSANGRAVQREAQALTEDGSEPLRSVSERNQRINSQFEQAVSPQKKRGLFSSSSSQPVLSEQETEVGRINLSVSQSLADAQYVEVVYETEPPVLIENNESEEAKTVTITSQTHYVNVTSLASLPRPVPDDSRVRLEWLVNGSQKELDFTLIDEDDDGLYERVRWVAPHLSTQTFRIVVITKASVLDADRQFVEDIYEQVRSLDGVWSPEVFDGQFVRVGFEKNLTSDGDITIFARVLSGDPRIEVYEQNSSQLLAQFSQVSGDSYDKVLLSSLAGEQDVFDLRIVGGSVSFDHIIDPDWYDNGWQYRKQITVDADQVAGDLTDFPVLISLSDEHIAASAQSDADDILFTSGDGLTKLDHEIDTYNSSTGELLAWVKVPSLSSSTDTPLYLYYGNSSVSSQENVSGTWSNNYLGVWHKDGTSGSAGGTITYFGSTDAAGHIGRARQYDGATDYAQVSSFDESFSAATMSAWVYTAGFESCDAIVFSRASEVTGLNTGACQDGSVVGYHWNDLAASWGWTGGPALTNGTWNYVAFSANSSDTSAYAGADGTLSSASHTLAKGSTTVDDLEFARDNNGGRLFDGIIDEVRISSVDRSAQWMQTEYNNQYSPQTFYSVSPTHFEPVLSSTSAQNFTNETLTAYNQSTSDADADEIKNLVRWIIDGENYATLYAPLDGGSNSTHVTDYSGNGYTGQVGGALFNATAGIDGFGAYSFDGSNDAIRFGDVSQIDSATQLTAMAWVQIDDLNKDNDILAKGPHSTNSQMLFWRDDSGGGFGRDNTLAVLLSDGSSDVRAEATAGSLDDSSWHHVAFTFQAEDPQGLRLYIDGVEDPNVESTVGFSSVSSNSNQLTLGQPATGSSPSRAFDGYIDDVRVYNRTLSAQQIARIYAESQDAQQLRSIVSNETRVDDLWQACITPNDGLSDGSELCSNTLQVRGLLEAYAPASATLDRDNFSADPDSVVLTAYAYGDEDLNVSFFVNLSSPIIPGQSALLLGSVLTNGSGYANVTFDPNSSFYAGNYTWYVQATNATTVQNASVLVYGSLNVSFQDSSLDPNASVLENDSLRINATLTSPGPENASMLNASYSALVNATLTSPAPASQTYTLSLSDPFFVTQFSAQLLSAAGVYDIALASSADYFYADSQTRNSTFFGLSSLNISDSSDAGLKRIFQNFTFSANYTDSSSEPINSSNASCSVRLNTTGSYGSFIPMQYDVSQQLYLYSTNFTDAGTFTYEVLCDEQYYLQQSANDTFVVNNTAVNSLSPVNGTLVDRDSANASVDDSVPLVLNVPDAIAGINITFAVTLIDPSTGLQDNYTIGTNLTEDGGNVTFNWDPGADIYAGTHRYFGSSPSADANDTKSVDVYGALIANFSSASSDPNASYNQSQTVLINSSLTNGGPENESVLSSEYGFSYNVTISLPNSSQEVFSLSQPYVASYPLANTHPVGVHNSSLQLAGDFFFTLEQPQRSFTVYGLGTLDVFDEQDVDTVTRLSGQNVTTYASWTDLDGSPIDPGDCRFTTYPSINQSMSYNGTDYLYNASYPFAGIFRYSVTCSKPYYNTAYALDNVTIASNVSLLANATSASLSDDLMQFTLSVENLQNFTEKNVSLFTVLPQSTSVSYADTPNLTQNVSGEHSGTLVQWTWDNLTGLSSYSVLVNLTGVGDWRFEPVLGISSPSASFEVYG